MKLYRWILLILGVGIIMTGGFFPDIFKINVYTIIVFFILAIPSVASYLKEATFPGAKFIFKDEIKETKKLVKESKDEAEIEKKWPLLFETFNLSSAKELLESDPVVALAALRIEIEKKLRNAVHFLDIPVKGRMILPKIIKALEEKNTLNHRQIKALKKILDMCNQAIHGVDVTNEEAEQIIDLADELNNNFSVGYSIDFSQNKNHEEHGLLCEWEHCIEWLPLTEENTELSCPVFGHNCPGDREGVTKCQKSIDDIPKVRFLKEN